MWVHPGPGTYDRIPIEPEGNERFEFKVVEATSKDGSPFRILFIDPKSRRGEGDSR